MSDDRSDEESDLPDEADFCRHVTTVILTILTGIFIFVSYHVFSSVKIDLLSWHVFLGTGSCLLFMPWAVLNVQSDWSILAQSLSPKGRQFLHAAVGAVAVLFALGSLLCIVVFKEDRNLPHFITLHAKLGLSTIIILVVASIVGIFLKMIHLKFLFCSHPFLNIVALILGLATECLGFNKVFFFVFTQKLSTRDACITLSIISILWVIVRPVISLCIGIERNL